jgi:hypothetical protein
LSAALDAHRAAAEVHAHAAEPGAVEMLGAEDTLTDGAHSTLARIEALLAPLAIHRDRRLSKEWYS